MTLRHRAQLLYNNPMERFFPTPDERERYSRQMAIPGWSETSQRQIRDAWVGIAGIGGLGSPVALYLAAAGVGRLTVCDYQQVERSNLNRQIMYNTDDLDQNKVDRTRAKLERLNPESTISIHSVRLDAETVAAVFDECDLIVDCLDNFSARHVLNQFCWHRRMPLVHGGIREYHGELFVMKPPETPCLACFLPTDDSNTGFHPVAGPVAGVTGSLQALEVLKILGGIAPVETGVLRMIDLEKMTMDRIPVPRRNACPVCGV